MALFRRTEEEKQLRTFYRHWYRRPSMWLALALPFFLLARLALTPLAWYEVRKNLAQLPEYDVSFSSLSLAIFSNQVVFRNVKVHHRSDATRDDGQALVTIPFVEMNLPLRRLFQGGPVERVSLIEPVFRLRTEPQFALSAGAKAAWLQAAKKLPLGEIRLLKIERGTVLAADQDKLSLAGNARPLIRSLDASIEGLVFGAQTTHNLIKTKINGGLMLGSGIVQGESTFTPDGDKSWDFSGELFVSGLDLRDIEAYALFPAATTVPPVGGKYRLKATYTATRGQLKAQLESQVQMDAGSVFSEESRAALEARSSRTSGMTVWQEGDRVQAALPAAMAPIRMAAVVPALVLSGAAFALRPAPAAPVATDVTAGVQPL